MTLCANPVKKPTPAPATRNGTAGLFILSITWYAVVKRLVKLLDISSTFLIIPRNSLPATEFSPSRVVSLCLFGFTPAAPQTSAGFPAAFPLRASKALSRR